MTSKVVPVELRRYQHTKIRGTKIEETKLLIKIPEWAFQNEEDRKNFVLIPRRMSLIIWDD